jgi:outer membrane lipoprotein LolB
VKLSNRAVGIVILAAALSACVSTPSHPPAEDAAAAWAKRMNELSAIDRWEVKGKLAVKTRRQGGQANMLWKRDGDDHNINLYGPLGGGRVVLTRDSDGAVLRDSKKRTYHAESAEAVLYRVAGWHVPFQSMRYWVLGMPNPGEEYEQAVDDWGRLQSLRQAGWEVEFVEYKDFEGRELPRKFHMTALPGALRLTADEEGKNDQVRVRVVIKRWRFLPS